MLRPHFEEPLAKVAATFGICVTLLKKICRRHGIARWPHRQITGLRKSIASMEHAIYYFDGARRESYVEQLAKQKIKLAALLADPTTKNDAVLATKEDICADQGSERPAIACAAQEAATDVFEKRTSTSKGQGSASPTGPFVGTSPYYGLASGVTPLQALPIWLPPIESSCSDQWPKAYSPSMVDHLHCEDDGGRTLNSYYNYVFNSAALPGRLPPLQSESQGILPPISSLRQ
uniref:RWP-RK domain-containing protein n=1 Tax=Peronospora matthiolae TaxID=2874970 RepID=A0AAV1TTJ1_9STRA